MQINQLISDYTMAMHELKKLLSDITNPSDVMVSKLDKKIQIAFNALISAELQNKSSRLRRINFLISVIKDMEFSSEIITQILDTIKEDVNA